MGGSVMCLPLATDLPSLVCMLLPLAMASSALTSTPTALVADLVDGGQQRSQALSLLRTAGDAGNCDVWLQSFVAPYISNHSPRHSSLFLPAFLHTMVLQVWCWARCRLGRWRRASLCPLPSKVCVCLMIDVWCLVFVYLMFGVSVSLCVCLVLVFVC